MARDFSRKETRENPRSPENTWNLGSLPSNTRGRGAEWRETHCQQNLYLYNKKSAL